MAAFGAPRLFRCVLEKIPLVNREWALSLGGGNRCLCLFAILDAVCEAVHRAIAAICRSGIVRCVLAGDTRWVLG